MTDKTEELLDKVDIYLDSYDDESWDESAHLLTKCLWTFRRQTKQLTAALEALGAIRDHVIEDDAELANNIDLDIKRIREMKLRLFGEYSKKETK